MRECRSLVEEHGSPSSYGVRVVETESCAAEGYVGLVAIGFLRIHPRHGNVHMPSTRGKDLTFFLRRNNPPSSSLEDSACLLFLFGSLHSDSARAKPRPVESNTY